MIRLETVAPDLVLLMQPLAPVDLRRVCEVAVQHALAQVDISDPRIDKGVAALRDGQFGDGAAYRGVVELTELLDEAAWDLGDRVEAGEALDDEQSRAFSAARAVNALVCALEEDPVEAALDAVYEAYMALDDPEPLEVEIRRAALQ